MYKKHSPYSEMYLVSPAIYERMLSCLDKADLNVVDSINKQVAEEREKRPSEVALQQLHQAELDQPDVPMHDSPSPQALESTQQLQDQIEMDDPNLPLEMEPPIVSPPQQIETTNALPIEMEPNLPQIETTNALPIQMEPKPPVLRPPRLIVPNIAQQQMNQIETTNALPIQMEPKPPVLRPPRLIVPNIAQQQMNQIEMFSQNQPLQKASKQPLIRPARFIPPIAQQISAPLPQIAQQNPAPLPLTFSPTVQQQNVVTKRKYRGGIAPPSQVPMIRPPCSGNLCSISNIRNKIAARNKDCPHCGKSFTRSWNLDRHIADVHRAVGNSIKRTVSPYIPQIGSIPSIQQQEVLPIQQQEVLPIEQEVQPQLPFQEMPALEYKPASRLQSGPRLRLRRIKAQLQQRADALRDTDTDMYDSWGPKNRRKRLQPTMNVKIRKDPYAKKAHFDQW